jgi:hypothetical protein
VKLVPFKLKLVPFKLKLEPFKLKPVPFKLKLEPFKQTHCPKTINLDRYWNRPIMEQLPGAGQIM